MKTICVYLGANQPDNPAFIEATKELASAIVEDGLTLVYGGSSLGMMGELANSVISRGGRITGVITKELLDLEPPHQCLDHLLVAETMQERKQEMIKRSDAFVVMPGGLGTLEEAFETLNAIKLGIINKPIGFLNTNYFFDGLKYFIQQCSTNGFIKPEHVKIPIFNQCPKELLSLLTSTEKNSPNSQ